jgi:peroxiredoxin family protein
MEEILVKEMMVKTKLQEFMTVMAKTEKDRDLKRIICSLSNQLYKLQYELKKN